MPISKYNVQLHTSIHFLETNEHLVFYLYYLQIQSIFDFASSPAYHQLWFKLQNRFQKLLHPWMTTTFHTFFIKESGGDGARRSTKLMGILGWYHFNRMDLSAPSVAVNDSSSGVLGQITFNELAFEESILLGLFISFPFFRDFQGQQLQQE